MTTTKSETEGPIRIVTAADDNYIIPAAVMMCSVLENTSPGEQIEFQLIQSGIKEDNKVKLNRLISQYPNASLHFRALSNELFSGLALNISYINIVTYFRFAIPHLYEDDIDRILYLDCDLVVKDDIRSLWETDIKGNIIGAVTDEMEFLENKKWPNNVKRKLGMPREKTYFNAGVLLMDLKLWRKEGISEACIRFLRDHPERISFNDQDALNHVLFENWFHIQDKWNVGTIRYKWEIAKNQKKGETDKPDIEASIIHYTGADKPWKTGSGHTARSYYLEYWNKTPWRKDFDIIPSHAATKGSIALITVCNHTAYLKKSLESWLGLRQVNEIIIVDNTGDEDLANLIKSLDSDRVTLVMRTDGILIPNAEAINVAVRTSLSEMILKVDPDVIVYNDFFENHKLDDKTFFNLNRWKDWFTKKEFLATAFFMNRKDFIHSGGYLNSIPFPDADNHFFIRLKANGLDSVCMDPDMIYCQSGERLSIDDFIPVPEFTLPLGDASQKLRLAELKAEVLVNQYPRDLHHPYIKYEVVERAKNILRISSDDQYANKVDLAYPQDGIIRKVLLGMMPEELSVNSNVERVIREAGPEGLKSLQKIFSDPLIFILLSQLNNMNGSNSMLLSKSGNKLQKEYEQNKKKLEAVYNSYTWKIGSAIGSLVCKVFGWLPAIKKRFIQH